MDQTWKRNIGRALKTLILIYIAGGIVLYFIQDLLLFHPTPLPQNHLFSFAQPFEEINIHSNGRNLNLVKFNPQVPSKGIVLFFHGNMKNLEHYKKYPPFFTRNGYAVWMIEYPGFGKSTGKRSEAILYQDALLMYKMATRETSSDSIIIYGKSIGTGVAAYLASERQCRKLILETPYYSIDALAKHYFPVYPVMPMTKYAFPIYTYLPKVKAGIIVMHGTKDEVVPFEQAHRLQKENSQLKLVTIVNGKHNNLSDFPLYQQSLDSVLRN